MSYLDSLINGPKREGPYYAKTASTKGDEDWPFWMVCDATGYNATGGLGSRQMCEALAEKWNADPPISKQGDKT